MRVLVWTMVLLLIAVPPMTFGILLWLEYAMAGRVTLFPKDAYPMLLTWAFLGGGVTVKWWQAMTYREPVRAPSVQVPTMGGE